MIIHCPFCGPRESGEFTYLGDAAPRRPSVAAEAIGSAEVEDAFHEYVYLRDNVAGPMREYWYHGGGCRSWLVAGRDTRTHAFEAVVPAPGAGAGVAAAGEG